MLINRLFILANIYIVPFWFLMIVLPNLAITKKIMKSYLPYIPLIGLYVYYLIISFNSQSIEALTSFQLADIAALFSQETTAGATWIHFLVVDLFVGIWIYWQGQEKNIWTTHSLILCIFICPVGLLSHIITDTFFGDKNGDSEKNAA